MHCRCFHPLPPSLLATLHFPSPSLHSTSAMESKRREGGSRVIDCIKITHLFLLSFFPMSENGVQEPRQDERRGGMAGSAELEVDSRVNCRFPHNIIIFIFILTSSSSPPLNLNPPFFFPPIPSLISVKRRKKTKKKEKKKPKPEMLEQ